MGIRDAHFRGCLFSLDTGRAQTLIQATCIESPAQVAQWTPPPLLCRNHFTSALTQHANFSSPTPLLIGSGLGTGYPGHVLCVGLGTRLPIGHETKSFSELISRPAVHVSEVHCQGVDSLAAVRGESKTRHGLCSIVDFKYIVQQLRANELQAMAFYTQMIHSGISRIFELLRYNGTY